MAMYKVGDMVKVVVADEDCRDAVGLIGKIVDVDEEWVFPYEIDFGVKVTQELFSEKQLVQVLPETIAPYERVIKFQEGTVTENGVNGWQIEELIDVLVERLSGFQKGNLPCRENAIAITKLEEARMWLSERTRKREEQGIEGSHIKHV